jgi:hypothetical protein
VQRPECGVETREAFALEPGGVLPFGQAREPLQGAVRVAGEQAGGEPLRLAVHRLDGGQARGVALVQDAVRVHDLPVAVPDLDLARDEPLLADGQQLLHARGRHVEEHQRHVPGVVLDEHLVGRLGAAERGRAVVGDGDGERDRLPHRRLRDRSHHLP